MTTPEIRRLFAKLILATRQHPVFTWAWYRWRQIHQAIAALCHRKYRLQTQL